MKRLATILSIAALSITAAAQKPGPKYRVTSVQLHVDPVFRDYKGACPVRVVFKGGITTNGPTNVEYSFEASDGHPFAGKMIQFRGNGTLPVEAIWPMNHDFSGWLALKPAPPFTYIQSTRAFFNVKCTGHLKGK